MTSVAKKVIQNIPAPFHLVAFERAQENWKNRKIQILLGSGLTITGLALIPFIGAYAAIVCVAGLAILGRALFADPESSSPRPLLLKTPRVRIGAPTKPSLPQILKETSSPTKIAVAGVLGSAAAFLAINELLKPASGKPIPPTTTPTTPTTTPTHTTPTTPTHSNPTPIPTPNPAPKTFTISIGGAKPIGHNVPEKPFSFILETPVPPDTANSSDLGSVPVSNPGHLTTPTPAPSTKKPLRFSPFTVGETLGFYAASSTPDESLLRLLRSQPKDTICFFESGLGPRQDSKTLRISSNASKVDPAPSLWEGIDISKPDQKMLFFTALKETVTANPTGGEVALPAASRPTITVTETSAKDFLQHSQFLFETLNKFDSAATDSVPALTSGASTTPAPLVSTPSSSKKPDQPFTILTVAEALAFFTTSSTRNDAFVTYLLSQPKTRKCVFPSSLVPNQGTGPLGLPAAKHSEPLNALESAFSGFETTDQKILFYTVSIKGLPAAHSSGLGLVPLDSTPQATITVTEMSVKDFASAQHSRLFFESLKEFYSGQMKPAGKSPLALPSGTLTTPPDLVSTPSPPSTKPFSLFTVSEILQSTSPTPNAPLVSYLLTKPKDAIGVFLTAPLSLPATPSVAQTSPVFGSPLSDFDFSATPNREILLFTAAQVGVAANPIGTELALPEFTGQPAITVTETTVKEFTSPQHPQFLLESLNRFEELQGGKVSVPALISGTLTTPPASVISAPSPSINHQPFSLSLLEASHPSVIEPPPPTSLDKTPIPVTVTTVKDFASAQHAQFPLPLNYPFNFDPLRLASGDALFPSEMAQSLPNISNVSTSDPASALSPGAQMDVKGKHFQFLLDSWNKFNSDQSKDAAFNDLVDRTLGSNPNIPAAPESMFSYMSSLIPSWFSLGSAPKAPTPFELPLTPPQVPAFEISSEPIISNTSSPSPDLACEEPANQTAGETIQASIRPSQYLLEARSKLKSDQRNDIGLDDFIDGVLGSKPNIPAAPESMLSYMSSWIPSLFSLGSAPKAPAPFELPLTPPHAPVFEISSEPIITNTSSPSPDSACEETIQASRRPSQYLLDARSKLKSDKRRDALQNDLLATVLNRAENLSNSSPAICPQEPPLALVPFQTEPEVSMFSYLSSWIPSWFSAGSIPPQVPLNLVAQPFCPANSTPRALSTGLQEQPAIASPAALAPNLAPLAIATVLLLAANGTKKPLEFCPLSTTAQTGPLDLNEVTSLILRKEEPPSLLASLLSAGFTHAQDAAKTGVSLLATEVLYPAGSYAYSKGGEALAELRDQGAAGLQANWEERKKEVANYGLALKWTADTGLPWIAKEIVYPTGAYAYTQASWILPEIRDRGAALLRSAGNWAAENSWWALTEIVKGVRDQANGAYKKLALSSAPSSPPLEKQEFPTAQATNLASTNCLWNPLKGDEKKATEEIIPIEAKAVQTETRSKAESEVAGSQARFEDATRKDALFDAEVALLTTPPALQSAAPASQEVVAKPAIEAPAAQPEALGSQTRFEDAARRDALFDAEVALLTPTPVEPSAAPASREVLTEVAKPAQIEAPATQPEALGSQARFEDAVRTDALFDAEVALLTPAPVEPSAAPASREDVLLAPEVVKAAEGSAPVEQSAAPASQEVLTKEDVLPLPEVVKGSAPAEKSEAAAIQNERQSSDAGSSEKYKRDKEADDKMDAELAALGLLD